MKNNQPLAEGEILRPGQWTPNCPPLCIIPPAHEPGGLDEITGDPELYRRLYYERSGRYLGAFETKEACDLADPYRYTRKYLAGGRLPWEQ